MITWWQVGWLMYHNNVCGIVPQGALALHDIVCGYMEAKQNDSHI